ncbi:[NiFe]-hydrogenase assembly chaperone HybE [Sulfuricella sp.]|uniref:[NiFe]-hydrogenase assembly chaperone HybE n=1 Tax=Sulfuricella sp. TaxID=2099377 RepID=UPI002C893A50|nr:[NiFe]-hydrogenase assembly chaperone HybE [Sulfuricella sp.]HUX64558.1 [NiFe]-hydrogenase assembly chaperone HybE [Sulfuricella sp.]
MMRSSESVEAVHPGPLLEEIYRKIHREHMLGLPILNPDLEVEAVGFVPFRGLWVGILITPWFMNLMLLSGTALCPVLAEGESQSWLFPGGALKFYAGFEAEVGSCQVCSLFSPMREFANQEEARAAAQAVLNGLFTEIVSAEPEPPVPVQTQPAGPLAEMRVAVAAPMTKRDFLRGSFLPGRQREPRG